jgi:hypothetical protein
LRSQAAGADTGSLVATAKSLVAIRNWTFVLGPGFVVGVGNGLILDYLMYRSRLVPRGMAMLGLIGGPLICLSGIPVVMNIIGRGSCGAEHRDNPGVPLGAIPRHLSHRQRLRAIPDHD